MMGLAVGIDYSLFIVSRYREERAKGHDSLEAIGRSGATANRAVFFSGLTVVLALAGMMLVPTTIFRGLAGGAILVVLVSVAASMTLLPALMSLLGTPAKRVGSDWLDWPWMSRTANALALLGMIVAAGLVGTIASAVGAPGALAGVAGLLGFIAAAIVLTRLLRRESSWFSRRIRHEQIEQGRPGGFWDSASRAVMARPVISLVLSASFMIVLSRSRTGLQSNPHDDSRGMRTGFSGISTIPDGVQTKEAFEVLIAKYSRRRAAVDRRRRDPRTAASDPSIEQQIEDARRRGRGRPSSRSAPRTAPERGWNRHPRSLPASPARRPITRARPRSMPSPRCGRPTSPKPSGPDSGVLVGGDTATVKDFFDISAQYTPIIILLCSGCRSSC